MDRIIPLAQDVLSIAKAQLLVGIRFLDRALYELKPVPVDLVPLATDGRYMYFDPMKMLMAYRRDQGYPVRVWAHMLMHCLYRHMFVSRGVDHRMWDLACDMAVEEVLRELNIRQLQGINGRVARLDALDAIRKNVKTMTAEHIYRHLLDDPPAEETLQGWEEAFSLDDHKLWYVPSFCLKLRTVAIGDGSKKDNESQQNDGEKRDGSGESEDQQDGNGENQNGGGRGQEGDDENQSQDQSGQTGESMLSEMWKEISERIQMDLETFAKQQGNSAGGMLQSLRSINRERCDYRQFLRKFASRTEVMRLSPDEFDYVFYTYGLSLYDDMPLVEPLEYREDKRIREFVIAIDTSGSVKGKQVQKFLQKTFTILKQEETFDRKFKLHIIQCDAAIQEDVEINTQDDFDRYIQTMNIRGLGGTDFRPVFEHVEQLRVQKKLRNLKGLIYFTDGYGTFPEKQPDYLTAFIFVDQDFQNVRVPPWAIKLLMETEELDEDQT